MEAQLQLSVRRTAAAACRSTRPSSSPTPLLLSARRIPQQQQIRHQATSSRHKRALRVAPHPSFITSTEATAPKADHIIFNPPSSEPNILSTPFKFLPKTDPRRRANLPALFSSLAPPTPTTSTRSGKLPPLLPYLPTESQPKVHHLKPEDVAEMRRLRSEDPVANSVVALAAKFGCSKLFVMMCCHAPKEHQEKHKERLEAVRERWGPVRSKAREDRVRRKALLLRGEL
ncbi:mitochondrial ribosomal protein subunit L20-domain-containing protein [Coniochaeta sp. 2T2.1]|nr:mitochondrial ribosomal protein subunit L20-domain-containing protein [Coniochaeta sp. 2T2.1]